jgi:hypothetical protein
MKKESLAKIRSCKALQGLGVADIISMPRFRENLAMYLHAQREDREKVRASYQAMRKLGGTKGYKLPAHVVDKVIDMSCEAFTLEYIAVIFHTSKRPFAERQYILQLGNQAYNVTLANIVIKEFPELKEYFYPKKNES